MYGNSIPAANADGDLFEYINFQQRYNIDARIQRAKDLSTKYLEPLSEGAAPQNLVDVHLQWLRSKPEYTPEDARQYRKAKSSEQLRIAENLQELYHCGSTAGRCPGAWEYCGQDRVDGARHFSYSDAQRTRFEWKNHGESLRDHQSQASAIGNGQKCIGHRHGGQRTRDRDHAVWGSAP